MTDVQIYIKTSCETCLLISELLVELFERKGVEIINQEATPIPGLEDAFLDADLERSFNAKVEAVPTVILNPDKANEVRLQGWVRHEWTEVFGEFAHEHLPNFKPGCASKTLDPGRFEQLQAAFEPERIQSRRLTFTNVDDIEVGYDRGWSDGLPVVPPTAARVHRMLSGTNRQPDEVIGRVPPDYGVCTVEKIAVNAVLAGCLPEYLPVVIAAVEAALEEPFCMHGLLATTYFSGPMVVVNGPYSRAIGMNSGGNALGQGNRANATIGRALQLVVRNVGGGKPGGVDRSALGNPGKYTFCFSEDELNSSWDSLSVERGYSPDASTVTLFAADGVQGIVDQKSRDPESLARSFAAALRVVGHPKFVRASDAFLVVSPEHERVFRDAGWSKQQLIERLTGLLTIRGSELIRGAGGMEEGLDPKLKDHSFTKFREGGLFIVRAGGNAGLFSAIIAGWGASGEIGSVPVTKEIRL